MSRKLSEEQCGAIIQAIVSNVKSWQTEKLIKQCQNKVLADMKLSDDDDLLEAAEEYGIEVHIAPVVVNPFKQRHEVDNCLVLDYQPGNGTRYLLAITWVPTLADELCSRRLLTWINNHRSMEIPNQWGGGSSPLTIESWASYISGKMDCCITDARAIAGCFNSVLK
jgi:hypothetical protein